MSEAERKERLERLKADAETRKPLRAPETERTEQDSRRTNPEVNTEPSDAPEIDGAAAGDPQKPFI